MATFTWIDGALVLLAALTAWSAVSRGFLQVATTLAGFVLTLLVALSLAVPVSGWLERQAGLAPLWAAPVGFLIVWLAAQLVFGALAAVLLRRSHYRASRSGLNQGLAVIPGALHGLLIGTLVLTFLATAPLPGPLQQTILTSALAGPLVRATIGWEGPLEAVFGPALRQSFGFLTAAPAAEGEGSTTLKFRVADPPVDSAAEDRLLTFVNAERSGRGLAPLAMDSALQQLARAHAAEMFQQGYFAHTGPDGRTPFDRMRDAHIVYTASGENLALAATTEAAHAGLMNSPTHRANILNPAYRRVGIGVVDGGSYGEMFVQEFTN